MSEYHRAHLNPTRVSIGISKCLECPVVFAGWYRKCPTHGKMKNTILTFEVDDLVLLKAKLDEQKRK